MKAMIAEAYEDAIDFLFRIDDPIPEGIDDNFYEIDPNKLSKLLDVCHEIGKGE